VRFAATRAEYYEFTKGVDVRAMIEATVSRYNYLVYLKY